MTGPDSYTHLPRTFLHDSDLSDDVDLLHADLKACREEIGRLRARNLELEDTRGVTADTPFMRVIREIVAVHDRKQLDYGRDDDPLANVRASEDFGIPAWVGALIRANDKMRRLQKAASGGELANESIRDSLTDNIVYFAIATVLFDEANQ